MEITDYFKNGQESFQDFWGNLRNMSETYAKHVPNMSNAYPNKCPNVCRTCPKCVPDMSTNVQNVTWTCRNRSNLQGPGTLVIGPRGSCRGAQGLLSCHKWSSATFLLISLLLVPLCTMLCPGSLVLGPGSLVVVESSTPARDPPAARPRDRQTNTLQTT